MKRIVLLPLALLAACDRTTPQEKAAEDANAVAQVEAAQKRQPPAQPVAPQPMKREARDLMHLGDDGCDFLPNERTSEDPVLLAGKTKALPQVREQPVILAADSGSPPLRSGAFTRYSGRDHTLALTIGEGSQGGSLTIRDRFERVVYFAAGEFTCM